MNIGSGKYHPGGTSCTYKGEIVPCLVRFSEGGIISGNILTNILRHLDYFKLHENDRKTSIVPTLLVDGHCSRFDIFKKKYICDENHKQIVVFGVLYGTSLWKIGDSIEQNGTYKIYVVK